jgi:hypothetical protein
MAVQWGFVCLLLLDASEPHVARMHEQHNSMLLQLLHTPAACALQAGRRPSRAACLKFKVIPMRQWHCLMSRAGKPA